MHPVRPGDPDIFFPSSLAEEAEAKGYCLGCPVRNECDEWAREVDAEYGIWAGEKRSTRS